MMNANSDHDPFIYKAAHDLRAPLMSVKGLISLMKKDTEVQNFDQYFAMLEKSVDKMNQSIDGIITHSKQNSNKLKPQQVNLKLIVEESIQSLRYMKGAESVQIDHSIEDGRLFYSDQQLLHCIFNNIISNAIRYRDIGKISFLKINVNFTGGACRTVFQDNGIGISEEVQGKVFDQFFRANNNPEGSGLGLYLVRESVVKLGGDIQLKSKPGEGTSFILQIPNLSLTNNF